MSLPKNGAIVPPIPDSPERYTWNHPDRIEKFPFKTRLLVDAASADSSSRKWRHELDHDAESVLWLLLYWCLTMQPADSPKEAVGASTWSMLTGPVGSCIGMLDILAHGRELPGITHSVYKPLASLLSDLSAILSVDRHWLDQSETRNHLEYVCEAFQRLLLQFILAHRDEEFMKKKVDLRPRQVEVISINPSLPSTETSRLNTENIKKRPSPQPPMKRMKRPRLSKKVRRQRVPL